MPDPLVPRSTPAFATTRQPRVRLHRAGGETSWSTVGVDDNVIGGSGEVLEQSLTSGLPRHWTAPAVG